MKKWLAKIEVLKEVKEARQAKNPYGAQIGEQKEPLESPIKNLR